MAEPDRFELDLAEALRSYAGSAPTEVRPTELARRFAAAYPRGGIMVGPWRLVALPRLAWFPLLLAVLLAVLVAGMLAVGSRPLRTLPAVVPAFTCPPGSTPDEPGPIDQARPPDIHPRSPMAFDRRAGRLIALAGADTGPGTILETWTFDVCTNTWTQMHPDREPGRPRSVASSTTSTPT